MANPEEKTDNDLYIKFLEKKHSAFVTSDDLIKSIVQKATGSELVAKNKIIEGEMNEVYDVDVKDGKNVIVRISRIEKESFESEENTIRLVRMAGVPAPKVLLIEEVSSDSKKVTFCVEEKMEGVSLKSQMKDLDKETLKKIIIEAGSVLSKIHSISIETFGPLEGGEKYNSWKDFIFRIENKKKNIFKAIKTVDINPTFIERAFNILDRNNHMFALNNPKLLHGEFFPKHLIIKDNHLVGVIDFEDAKAGDPVWDMAWLSYFYHDSIPIDWLKEGYENKELFNNDFDLKMKLYRLNLGLDFLDYYQTENNISGMRYAKERLLAEINNF
ncbi:MAG TPA: aminoglycoside phosphotransferase family protein [Patescibacteria group bacterium]|nr:aminoglycoside phosphotransferase family protein [Patescibacteria group bacterium]